MMDRVIAFEKLENPQGHEVWIPRLPEHNWSDQHDNAGMDFFSATRVVAEEVGVASRLPAGYFEISGSELSNEDVSFIHSQLVGDVSGAIVDMERNNVRIDYVENSPKPLRMYQSVIHTGLRMRLPRGYHMRIASRSGLGFKHNIFAFPGTIDSSYRGPIMIKLYQFTSNESPFIIEAGDKVAQGIVFTSPDYYVIEDTVSEAETSRGSKGFGSSG